jgi:hypothetical protein
MRRGRRRSRGVDRRRLRRRRALSGRAPGAGPRAGAAGSGRGPDPLAGGRIDLATQGANARRASEDSTAVAFVEAKGKPAEFARPIVEAAGIAFVEAAAGGPAMERVLSAVADAGTSGSLREKVREALE